MLSRFFYHLLPQRQVVEYSFNFQSTDGTLVNLPLTCLYLRGLRSRARVSRGSTCPMLFTVWLQRMWPTAYRCWHLAPIGTFETGAY